MSNNNTDDKYTREGDDCSQVRNIINQLNSDTPSREKSREVVVREDGTKVVRVTKKRRVMVTKDEKNRRSRKKLLVSLLVVFILFGCLTAFYVYRMSAMCSDSYLAEKKQELCTAWGATSVEFKNPRVEGMTLVIDSVVAQFPESGMLSCVELTGISATLDMSSFFSGEFRADNMKIRRADVRVHRNCDKLILPTWTGEEAIFKIKTYSCDNFNFYIGAPKNATVAIEGAELQVHESAGSKVVSMTKGVLYLPGIGNEPKANGQYEFSILDGKLFITSAAIEDIVLNCRDPKNVSAEQDKETADLALTGAKNLQTADFVLQGRIAEGASLYGPYSLEIDRMSFKLITHGMFDKVLAAGDVFTAPNTDQRVMLTLSPNGTPAIFTGTIQLSDINFREAGLRAKSVYLSHIVSPHQSRNYKKVSFDQATVTLLNEEGQYILQVAEGAMVQSVSTDLKVTARIAVGLTSQNGQWNDLPISGNISYSLPKKVLNSEYENDAIDPIFVVDPHDDFRCVLYTKLSGLASDPQDDSLEQVANTDEARKQLTPRSTKSVDIDEVVDTIKSEDANTPQPSVAPVSLDSDSSSESDDDIFGEKEDKDAIFNQSINDQVPGIQPVNNGATVPVDPSVSF